MTSAGPGQLSDAVQAIRLGQKPLAREILAGIIEAEPGNEQAYIWAAAVAESPEDAIRHLERVLMVNPRNELASKALATHRLSHKPTPTPVKPLIPVDPPPVAPEPRFQEPEFDILRRSGPAPSVRRLFDARPEPAPPAQPERPPEKIELCAVCQQPREREAAACGHCGCAYTLRDFAAVQVNASVNERVVEQALLRLPARPESSTPIENLLGAGIAYLSLHRSAEALPFLVCAAEIQSQDYHLRVLCEDLANRKLVLVVDDSATVRRLVSITLERQGFRVKTAVHGRDGLEKFAAETPDFIFLDITMPEMDGYEFCKTIRRKPEGKSLPIVMLSGNDGIFDKVRGKVAGSTDYLNKPFHSEVLQTALHKHLKASATASSGRIFNLS